MVVVWVLLYVYINLLYFINILCVYVGLFYRYFWNDCYNIQNY